MDRGPDKAHYTNFSEAINCTPHTVLYTFSKGPVISMIRRLRQGDNNTGTKDYKIRPHLKF